jgi:hypothetical protein
MSSRSPACESGIFCAHFLPRRSERNRAMFHCQPPHVHRLTGEDHKWEELHCTGNYHGLARSPSIHHGLLAKVKARGENAPTTND